MDVELRRLIVCNNGHDFPLSLDTRHRPRSESFSFLACGVRADSSLPPLSSVPSVKRRISAFYPQLTTIRRDLFLVSPRLGNDRGAVALFVCSFPYPAFSFVCATASRRDPYTFRTSFVLAPLSRFFPLPLYCRSWFPPVFV